MKCRTRHRHPLRLLRGTHRRARKGPHCDVDGMMCSRWSWRLSGTLWEVMLHQRSERGSTCSGLKEHTEASRTNRCNARLQLLQRQPSRKVKILEFSTYTILAVPCYIKTNFTPRPHSNYWGPFITVESPSSGHKTATSKAPSSIQSPQIRRIQKTSPQRRIPNRQETTSKAKRNFWHDQAKVRTLEICELGFSMLGKKAQLPESSLKKRGLKIVTKNYSDDPPSVPKYEIKG